MPDAASLAGSPDLSWAGTTNFNITLNIYPHILKNVTANYLVQFKKLKQYVRYIDLC